MYSTLTINAYDALDRIVIAVCLRQKNDVAGDPPSVVETWTTTIPSTGETESREWLRDVLVGLLENT